MILLILYHLSGHSAKQVDSHKDDCWWSPGVAVWETEVRNPRVLSPDQSYRMIEDVLKKFIDEVSSFCWLILIYRMMEQYNEWFWWNNEIYLEKQLTKVVFLVFPVISGL